MFAQTVNIYEKIKFNLFKLSVFKCMTFKKYVNIMSYNVTKYVIDPCNLMAYMMVKKMANLSHMRHSNGRTHTYARTHTYKVRRWPYLKENLNSRFKKKCVNPLDAKLFFAKLL